MARLILAKTFKNRIKDGKLDNGKAAALSILENFDLGFTPKRIYWLYGLDYKEVRGGHRHKKVKHALICVSGGCEVSVNDSIFKLNKPDQCLLLEPKDWHTMQKFKKGTVLLVLASTNYNPKDYIYEPYKKR